MKRRTHIEESAPLDGPHERSGEDSSSLRSGELRRTGVASRRRLVVFACGTDIGRAHMAAIWFGMLADPVKARAVCASSSSVVRVDAQVSVVLREAGLPPAAGRPRAMTRATLAAAHLVVTIGDSLDRDELDLGGPTPRREHWLVPDLAGTDRLDRARDVRDLLRSRVAMLVFMEGWGRTDISREAARVTRPRRAIIDIEAQRT